MTALRRPDFEFDQNALRARLVPKLRQLLENGRAEAEELLVRTRDGLVCARALSSTMDRLVAAAYAAVTAELDPSDTADGESVAIVATGGYGRAAMAPGSGRRPPVPAAARQGRVGRSDRRGDPVCSLGPEAETRPRHPQRRRMRERGARRHDDPHHAPRGAVPGRGPRAVRRIAGPVRQGGRARVGGPVRRGQAEGARRQGHACGRLALPRRAQREGRQGGLARPQHALLDLEIRLWRGNARGVRQGRAVHRRRGATVRAVRGVPVAGALPSPFRDGPGGRAADLRYAAPRRAAPRLHRAQRPVRRRALHEGLFLHRQAGGRPHRNRLCRPGGPPRQEPPGSRPGARTVPAQARPTRVARFPHRQRPHQCRA